MFDTLDVNLGGCLIFLIYIIFIAIIIQRIQNKFQRFMKIFSILLLISLTLLSLDKKLWIKINSLDLRSKGTRHNFGRRITWDSDKYIKFYHIPHDYNVKRRPVILMWTNKSRRNFSVTWARGQNYFKAKIPQCDVTNCIFTSDHSHYLEADAIVIHQPSFQIGNHPLPPARLPHQRYVFYNHESPLHRSQKSITINRTFYNDFYNWTASYRHDSDIFIPYFSVKKLPNKMKITFGKILEAKDRKKMVVWFVSHCRTLSKREQYVKELSKYINVDIYGRCGNLTCEKRSSHDCFKNISGYWFYLSFENAVCNDYMTEKVMNPMLYNNLVPVVYGGADYAKFLPKKSYIDIMDHRSPRELAKFLTHLTRHPTEYLTYFAWKEHYEMQPITYPFCALCKRLNKREEKWKSYSDFTNWWYKDQCNMSWFEKLKNVL